MAFFDRFKRMWSENDAELWGEWCARMMIVSFRSLKEQHKSPTLTGTWVARQTMATRKKWKETGSRALCFLPTGEIVNTPENLNLRHAIHMVIDIEYGYELKDKPGEVQIEMILRCHTAAESYLNK